MITYKIHYISEQIPEEDINALFLLSPIHKVREYEGLISQRHVDILDNILKHTTASLNAFFIHSPMIADGYQTLHLLMDKVIPELQELARALRPNKKINQDVISLLQHLKDTARLSPVLIMKFLVQFDVPGVRQIEFNNIPLPTNIERLLDLEYPLKALPEVYQSALLGAIPSHATLTVNVDCWVVHHPIKTFNNALNQEIQLFMKKLEWLFYVFNENQQYLTAYHDDVIGALLLDKKISYKDFCIKVDCHFNQAHRPQFVFFSSGSKKDHLLIPVKSILDLFSRHQIHVIYPTKGDLEHLLRRLVVSADADGLDQLFSSPILELIKIDIYALNENGQDCMDLLNDYRDKYPRLDHQYVRCESLLLNYQKRPSTRKNSSCVMS